MIISQAIFPASVVSFDTLVNGGFVKGEIELSHPTILKESGTPNARELSSVIIP